MKFSRVVTEQRLQAFCDEARRMAPWTPWWSRRLALRCSRRPGFHFVSCQYGCSEYGQCLTCPPHSPTPETMRKVLDEYQAAILLHGDNWKSVRDIARSLERKVFLAGCYKALAFVCGPCWSCKTCAVAKRKGGVPAACKHPDKARPAMEAAGIDVFATARAAGLAHRGRPAPRTARRTITPSCWWIDLQPIRFRVYWRLMASAGVSPTAFPLRGFCALPSKQQTVERCVDRMNRLYEQGADSVRIGN